MTVWVDDAAIPYKGRDRFHLAASSSEELHEFARAIGVKRCWYRVKAGKFPHYDITGPDRLLAIAHGAVPTSTRALVTELRMAYP